MRRSNTLRRQLHALATIHLDGQFITTLSNRTLELINGTLEQFGAREHWINSEIRFLIKFRCGRPF